jgi:hypothetical protein
MRTEPIAAASMIDEWATAQTVAAMAASAARASVNPSVINLARRLGSSDAAFSFLQRSIEYVSDESNPYRGTLGALRNGELLITPEELLGSDAPAGDCDEFSSTLAALLLAMGRRPCFRVLAADPAKPDSFSHVYVIDGGRALDASHGPYPGWEAAAGMHTRFGAPIEWTGTRRDFCPVVSAQLNGLGGPFSDALAESIPGLIETGSQVLLRRGTPTGYYRQTAAGELETRVGPGSSALLSPSLSGSGNFPWAWLIGGGAALLIFRGAFSGGRR